MGEQVRSGMEEILPNDDLIEEKQYTDTSEGKEIEKKAYAKMQEHTKEILEEGEIQCDDIFNIEEEEEGEEKLQRGTHQNDMKQKRKNIADEKDDDTTQCRVHMQESTHNYDNTQERERTKDKGQRTKDKEV